ncbi:hypothetical protein GCM10009836_23250 [Pseudonocardia ailaonensis]|uniref:Uncharacterized protein n=1 Tax=Pseudonocardia ailaonensis TaxID=367279 RepID=A0ABN2MZ98_9PSEU
MSRARRVAVTSPQTRVALARRGAAGAVRSLTAEELATAARVRRRQLQIAAGTLVGAAVLLVGLPALLDAWTGLRGVRLVDLPIAWLAVAVLPYPALALLAWRQLRRAEGAERPGTDAAAEPLAPPTSESTTERTAERNADSAADSAAEPPAAPDRSDSPAPRP